MFVIFYHWINWIICVCLVKQTKKWKERETQCEQFRNGKEYGMNHIEQTEWAAETTWNCARSWHSRHTEKPRAFMACDCNLCVRAPLCSRCMWARLECVGPVWHGSVWRFYGFYGHRLVFCANLFTPTKNINSIQIRSIIHATDIFPLLLLHFCTKKLMVGMFHDAGCAMQKPLRTCMVFVWKIDMQLVSTDWYINCTAIYWCFGFAGVFVWFLLFLEGAVVRCRCKISLHNLAKHMLTCWTRCSCWQARWHFLVRLFSGFIRSITSPSAAIRREVDMRCESFIMI